jgi:multidrug resistance protein, MATE family
MPWPRAILSRLPEDDLRRVLGLALPAVGEQVLNLAVVLVDTYLVGHLGADAVAAVGLSNQAVLMVTVFFAAVATGVTALVARHTGAREPEVANKIAHQGYLLELALGLALFAACYLLALPIMRLLDAPSEVVSFGTTYLQIVSFSFPLAALMFVGNAALRGSGDTRTPMLVMLVVNAINIVVAVMAINGLGPFPRMGVAGSALGAAAGRGAGGLLATAVLFAGRKGLTLRLRGFVPDVVQLKRIMNIGMPAGAEQVLMRMAQTVFAVTVAGLGTQAFAAHQLALQGESISYMPGFGFSVAATTLMGQGLGAGDPGRARADARLAHVLAVISMSIMGVFFFVFAAEIMHVFIDDAAVIALGVWPLRLVAFSQPALATAMVVSGGLRGAGDTRSTLLITAAGFWIIRIPLALLLVVPFGLIGTWIAMGLDINIRGLLMFLRFRSGRWATIRV